MFYKFKNIKIYITRALFFAFALMFSVAIFAQEDPDCVTKNKKAEKLYEQALNKQKSGDREEAYQLLINCINLYPDYVKPYYKLAEINYRDANFQSTDLRYMKKRSQYFNKSIKYFIAVTEICPAYDNYGAYAFLGGMYESKLDYKNARFYIDVYCSKNKDNNGFDAESARKLKKKIDIYFDLLSNPVDFNPKVVKGVSTKKDEYLPMITPDGRYMFYTKKYVEADKFSQLPTEHEDFIRSKRTSEHSSTQDVFSSGNKMPPPFNDGRNMGGAAITIDNKHIFLTICEKVQLPPKYRTKDNAVYDNCDIFKSDLNDGVWSKPKRLLPVINGKYTWESQPTISSDGKTLFFTSIRNTNVEFREQFPSCDIWYSNLQEDGSWGKAENLGTAINTKGNEKTPFMHSDSKTLYFSSDGLPGMGGYDIYFSKLESNGKWSEPENIGYPINNELDNLGLIVSTFGKKAYFTSRDFKGAGGLDIFSFILPKKARPDEVMLVQGQVNDDKGKPLEDASVEVRSSKTNRVIEGMVDKKTGHYSIAINVEEDEEFLMTVKKENYAFSSAYIKPEEKMIEKPVEIELEVKPIEIGQNVEIKDVHFETTSYVFDQATAMILESFYDFLKSNPNIKVEIHGHTDNIGDEQPNLELSEKRAKSVKSYLTHY